MRYGHLLAGLIFLTFLFFLGAYIVSAPSPRRSKVDVSSKNNSAATTRIDVPANYYTDPQGAEARVRYTETGFSPVALTVAAGTIVVFENHSSFSFWPIADLEPGSGGYPQTGSCGASAFDSCAPIPPGATWSLRFDRTGSWGYHNNLNPGHTGRIVVK